MADESGLDQFLNPKKNNSQNSKAAAIQPGNDIAAIFSTIINQLHGKLTQQSDETMSVDIEMTFKNVTVDENGFPLFSNKTVSNATEIRLACRVRRI